MADKSLVPVLQKEVVFYEDTITAVVLTLENREEIYVPIRPLCEYLGMDWSAQYRRIKRDPILSESIEGVAVTTTPSSDGRGGGAQEMIALPLKFLPGWLFGINAARVKPELQAKILRYQRESYDVLWEAFQEGRLTAELSFDDLLSNNSPAAQAYTIATAIMKMARQQLMLESQLESHATIIAGHEQRLEEIESTLGNEDRFVTAAQAMEISQAVKLVAGELGKRSKKNEYGGVYGQLYRHYGVVSYKQLPAGKFESAMTWLRDWYRRTTGAMGDDVPF